MRMLVLLLLLCFSTLTQAAYTIRYPDQVNALLDEIRPQNMWKYVSALTQFEDRNAYHTTGREAAIWVQEKMQSLVKKSGRSDVTLYPIATKGRDRDGDYHALATPSVVMKIGEGDEGGVVIGAHFDTVSCQTIKGQSPGCKSFAHGRFPGADDDASGTAAVLEASRALLTSKLVFRKPIYLILYAAEEEGLLGSQCVVQAFKKKGIKVDAVMQLDMIGYMHQKNPTLWFDASHTNSELNEFGVKLVKSYIKKPAEIIYGEDSGESDHVSWESAGVNTIFPFESICYHDAECPGVDHTSRDTQNKLSLTHMTDYLKLALSFAVELAEPKA